MENYLSFSFKAWASMTKFMNFGSVLFSILILQICGVAGRRFYELTQKKLPRITGLDPASKQRFTYCEILFEFRLNQVVQINKVHALNLVK